MDRLSHFKFALHQGLGEMSWQALALLGEAAILLPAAAVVALWLWRTGRVGEAQAWGLSVIACAVTVGLMKLGFGDFKWAVYGHTFKTSGFPSGHAAMATVFWGGLALLAAGRCRAVLLLLPIPIVWLAVLVLWWHHTLDVAGGFAVGAASLLPVLLRAPRRLPRSAF
jgi:membrane-associated phospholipid phosphatase